MNNHQVTLSDEQLNRIFPFHILLAQDLCITSAGSGLAKQSPVKMGNYFFDHFTIQPDVYQCDSFSELLKTERQSLIIETKARPSAAFSGQFEVVQNGILFIGQPVMPTIHQERIATHTSLHPPETPNTGYHSLTQKRSLAHSPEVSLNTSPSKDLVSGLAANKTFPFKPEIDYKSVINAISENVWDCDLRSGTLHFSNQDWGIISKNGETPDTIEQWKNCIEAEDRPNYEKTISRYRRGNQDDHTLEYRITTLAGITKWILERAVVALRGANGAPLMLFGTHKDITQRKQIELNFEKQKSQFNAFAENIPGVIYEYEYRKDGTEGVTYLSPAIVKVFGIPREEYLSFQKFIHQEDRARIAAKNEIAKTTLTPYYDESRLIFPDGRIIWRSVSASFSRINPEGAVVFTGFMSNITERKKAEQALQMKEDKYRGIITNMQLGLLEVDDNDRIEFANQSFLKMSGYTIEDLLGKKASEILLHPDDARLMSKKNEQREQDYSDVYEIRVRTKSNAIQWWLISGAPRLNDSGKKTGSIGIHLDITKQKALENELRQSKLQAEKTAKAREIFLAYMSHEMRTPMNAIIGLGGQLKKTNLDEHQNNFLNSINTASKNLLVIINDILDLSKMEAGKLSLEAIGFRPEQVLGNMEALLRQNAEEKGLQLEVKIDPKIAKVLLGDPTRIQQILVNIAFNAIKFTEKGGVYITLTLLDEIIRTQKICIQIQDSGIGIDESFADLLFQPYIQEHQSTYRKYGGSGLGLTITKQLVEIMDGTISVNSKQGVGTTFTIELQLPIGSEAELPNDDPVTAARTILLKDKKILLVEDNAMNRLVATTVLQQYGATISEVENGVLAVSQLRDEKFDLVLMDLQLPEMDGITATKIIRATISAQVPIIALTANAMQSEKDRCYAAGMNDFITKPFEENILISTLAKWLNSGDSDLPTGHTDNPDGKHHECDFDLTMLRSISGGNDQFLVKMIRLFIEQAPQMANKITEHFNLGELEKMGAVAHKLKASVGSMGIAALTKRLVIIEHAAKSGALLTNLQEHISEINTTLNRVVLALKELPQLNKTESLQQD